MKVLLKSNSDGLTKPVPVIMFDRQVKWAERASLESQVHNYMLVRNGRGTVVQAVQKRGPRAPSHYSRMGDGDAFQQHLSNGRKCWALAGVRGSEFEADKRQPRLTGAEV